MMKHLVWKVVLVAAVAACGLTMNGASARADGMYFHGLQPYYLGPVYAVQPYYPAPVVTYGYGYVAGPPVWNMEYAQPAYYYPETIGWYGGYYPAKVKYKYKHGYVKVEIDD